MSDRTRNHGFTLIELLIVVAIIGVIASVAAPGLLRARMAGNEASAIASLRAVNAAQSIFAASCGGGFYAPSLEALGNARSRWRRRLHRHRSEYRSVHEERVYDHDDRRCGGDRSPGVVQRDRGGRTCHDLLRGRRAAAGWRRAQLRHEPGGHHLLHQWCAGSRDAARSPPGRRADPVRRASEKPNAPARGARRAGAQHGGAGKSTVVEKRAPRGRGRAALGAGDGRWSGRKRAPRGRGRAAPRPGPQARRRASARGRGRA